MGSVLLYVRPWNFQQFDDLAKRIWPESQHKKLSEHKSCDESGFINYFYSYFYKSEQLDGLCDYIPFSEKEISDVIDRCRLLRSVNNFLAQRLIYSACEAIQKVLAHYKPQYILSVTVDSYIIDLLARLSKNREIKFIGLVPTFVDGYFRITERGEKAINRKVDPEEVDDVLSMLTRKEYKPQWLAVNKKNIRKKAIRLWARNLVKPAWFFIYSRVKRDPLNAHYMTTDIVSKKYLSFFPRLYNGFDSTTSVHDEICRDERGAIFFPLQMSPEATIDYWSSDKSWIDYEQKVLETVKKYSHRFVFVVKEHPNVFGFRSPGFYRKLLDIENVILVNPEVSSNSLIEICDSVLVCTGTVGFESLLRGKPVISTSNPFYASHIQLCTFDLCFYSKNLSISDVRARQLVECLLSGLLPGVFINDGTWDEKVHASGCYNNLIGESIQLVLRNEL